MVNHSQVLKMVGTKGPIGSIEAAEAVVKAAGPRLTGQKVQNGGGLGAAPENWFKFTLSRAPVLKGNSFYPGWPKLLKEASAV